MIGFPTPMPEAVVYLRGSVGNTSLSRTGTGGLHAFLRFVSCGRGAALMRHVKDAVQRARGGGWRTRTGPTAPAGDAAAVWPRRKRRGLPAELRSGGKKERRMAATNRQDAAAWDGGVPQVPPNAPTACPEGAFFRAAEDHTARARHTAGISADDALPHGGDGKRTGQRFSHTISPTGPRWGFTTVPYQCIKEKRDAAFRQNRRGGAPFRAHTTSGEKHV